LTVKLDYDNNGKLTKEIIMIKTDKPINDDNPARIGSIVIGSRKKSGKGFYPQKIDYFKIIRGRDKDGDQHIDDDAMKAIGNERPTELKIFLPFQTIKENFHTERAMYTKLQGGGGPVIKHCYCDDGDTAHRVVSRGVVDKEPCDGDECKHAISGLCKMLGTLSVILSDVGDIGGVYKYRTTSWHTIRNINSSLKMIESVVKRVDDAATIAFIPLVLAVFPDLLQTPKNGIQTFYTCVVKFKGDNEGFERAVAQLAARTNKTKQIIQGHRRALMEPEPEDTDTFITEEYYPDAPELITVTEAVDGNAYDDDDSDDEPNKPDSPQGELL